MKKHMCSHDRVHGKKQSSPMCNANNTIQFALCMKISKYALKRQTAKRQKISPAVRFLSPCSTPRDDLCC